MTPTLTRNIDLLCTEVQQHIAADSVVQGQYWSDSKGCFIGCLTHSDDPTPAVERFGLTEPILRIAEEIFESLPAEEAVKFFAAFPDAVATDGKDLSLVHWKFLAETLRNLPPQAADIQAVIDPVITGMNLLAEGGTWDPDAAEAAARAAFDAPSEAALAPEAAARSATGSASSVLAALATEAAARAAARSAGSARAAETCRQRDSLLRLIREAPVV